MKKIQILLIVLLAVSSVASAGSLQKPDNTFNAVLSGSEEVPPRATEASGAASFSLINDGAAIDFRLSVANIQNVFAAHIHCGAFGVNGPVGVTLFMGMPGSGPVTKSVLASGTITAPDAGNACGWMSIGDVVAAIQSGNTYVNVHTNDGIDPPNTGPGDFPGGEIRGQIH